MSSLIENQDLNDIIMVSIFIFLCASIIFLLILSYFKDKKKQPSKTSEKKPLELLDLSIRKDSRGRSVLPKTDKELRDAKDKVELEIVLAKMKEDLNKKEHDVVKTFEQEQEEKSVISYQELLNKAKASQSVQLAPEIETLDFDEEIKLQKEELRSRIEEVKPTAIKRELPVELPKKTIQQEQVSEAPKNPLKQPTVSDNEPWCEKKFKNSEFISPVYGRMAPNLDYPKIDKFDSHEIKKEEEFDFDNLEIKDIEEEIKKSERFLIQLKEFRKNLE